MKKNTETGETAKVIMNFWFFGLSKKIEKISTFLQKS